MARLFELTFLLVVFCDSIGGFVIAVMREWRKPPPLTEADIARVTALYRRCYGQQAYKQIGTDLAIERKSNGITKHPRLMREASAELLADRALHGRSRRSHITWDSSLL